MDVDRPGDGPRPAAAGSGAAARSARGIVCPSSGGYTGRSPEEMRAGSGAAARSARSMLVVTFMAYPWLGLFMASSISRTWPLMKRSVASYLTEFSAKLARSRSMSTLLLSRLVWLGVA